MSEELKVNGYRIVIEQDEDAESPREWDNFGIMVCFHSRYSLGDEHPKNVDDWKERLALELDPTLDDHLEHWRNGPGYTMICNRNNGNLRAAYDAVHERERGLIDAVLDKHTVMLPLYLYDHSGITMNTTGFSCRWDSGQVGYIYATRDDILRKYGKACLTKNLRKQVEVDLRVEVACYDQYIRDDVWRFHIENEDGEVVDSCSGFYGYDYCKERAEYAASKLPPQEIKTYSDNIRRDAMKFKVEVEKRLYATGRVEVECDNEDQAVELVEDQINRGVLQTTAVEWNECQYEDLSFATTGDVERCPKGESYVDCKDWNQQ